MALECLSRPPTTLVLTGMFREEGWPWRLVAQSAAHSRWTLSHHSQERSRETIQKGGRGESRSVSAYVLLSCNRANQGPLWLLRGLAHRGHVEVRHQHRGHHGAGEPVLELPGQRALRYADT